MRLLEFFFAYKFTIVIKSLADLLVNDQENVLGMIPPVLSELRSLQPLKKIQ